MIEDNVIVDKLKPELKKFKLNHEEISAIAIAIKRNPQCLEECVDYLKQADTTMPGDEIRNEIINICYN